jgi:hypothetical protein
MMARTTRQVLYDVRQQLRTAQIGLEMLDHLDRSRALAGLRNVAVFGRAVTFVLQNLRDTEPAFDEWYAPHVAAMRGDELCRFFVELRNTIEKVGDLPVKVGTYVIRHFTGADMARLPPAPPNAEGMFMGDPLGRAGWVVRQPDGSTENFYFDLPADIGGPTDLQFPDPPKSHAGQSLTTTKMRDICRLYLDYLENLVQSAEARFLT